MRARHEHTSPAAVFLPLPPSLFHLIRGDRRRACPCPGRVRLQWGPSWLLQTGRRASRGYTGQESMNVEGWRKENEGGSEGHETPAN